MGKASRLKRERRRISPAQKAEALQSGGDPGVPRAIPAVPDIHHRNPLNALRAIATRRRQLDDLELVCIYAARRIGYSWRDIARQLGVTHSALLQRATIRSRLAPAK